MQGTLAFLCTRASTPNARHAACTRLTAHRHPLQVSPSSSCASPAGPLGAPTCFGSGASGNLDDGGTLPKDGTAAAAASTTDRVAAKGSSALSKSSFGRYASSNLKAAAQGGASSGPQPQPQPQGRSASVPRKASPPAPGGALQAPRPPRRSRSPPPERGLGSGSSAAVGTQPNGAAARASVRASAAGDAGALADLGDLQGGRGLHSLPVGVLEGPHRDGPPAGSPAQGLALSASLTSMPPPLPVVHTPHPPFTGAVESGGGHDGAAKPRRSLRSPPSYLQSPGAADSGGGGGTGATAVSQDSALSRRPLGLVPLGGLGGSSSQSVVSAARGEVGQSMASMRDLVQQHGRREEEGGGVRASQPLPQGGEALQGSSSSLTGSNVSLSGLAALKQSRQATGEGLGGGRVECGLVGGGRQRGKGDRCTHRLQSRRHKSYTTCR